MCLTAGMLVFAHEIANPLIPAWYDAVFSIVPLVFVVAMIAGLVSIIRRYRVMSVFESFAWTVAVVFVPVFGVLIWFVLGRARYGESVTLGASSQRHAVK